MDSHKAPKAGLTNPEEILAQIARLTAQLPTELKDQIVVNRPPPLKRKARTSAQDSSNVLISASPSPKIRRTERPFNSDDEDPSNAFRRAGLSKQSTGTNSKSSSSKPIVKAEFHPPAQRLSKANNASTGIYSTSSGRPGSANDGPQAFSDLDDPGRSASAVERDDCLAVIEKLELGPTDHDPPFGDPLFKTLEPNSRINLLSRKTSHDDIQELLRGRYFLSPSLLYSTVRLQKSRQGYDVPVDSEWVTIAVVAERGKVQVSRGFGSKQQNADGEEDQFDDDSEAEAPSTSKTGAAKKNQKKAPPGPTGKKYVSIKLVDFGHKPGSKGTGSSSGDAMLTLLLFEADMVSRAPKDGAGKAAGSTLYKGGSGGAFEELLPKLREGAVVVILNPRVLKPYQGKNSSGSDKPHPMSNILGISPKEPGSIQIVGYSKDLGMCGVKTKDGRVCGSWCDKRRSDVCEYHLLSALKSKRAGRAEFAAGTSGMSVSGPSTRHNAYKQGPHQGSKPGFDPDQKWGLLPSSSGGPRPRNEGAGITYVMSGTVINSARDAKHVGRQAQRDQDAKARETREKKEKQDEILLKGLLKRDPGGVGGLAVKLSKEHSKKMQKKEAAEKRAEGSKGKGKGKAKDVGTGNKRKRAKDDSDGDDGKDDHDSDEEDEEDAKESERREKLRKGVYNPDMLKRLGFDPTLKPGDARKAKTSSSVFQLQPREIHLSPRKGQKIRSGVLVPEAKRFKLIDKPTTLPPRADPLDVEGDEQDDSEPPPVSAASAKAPSLSLLEMHRAKRAAFHPSDRTESDSDLEFEIETPPPEDTSAGSTP